WTSGHAGRAAGELTAAAATTVALGLVDGSGAAGAVAVREASTATTIRLPTSESWGLASTLQEHFLKHGGYFSIVSGDDYAIQASAFLQASQLQGLPTKVDAKGVIRIYDPS